MMEEFEKQLVDLFNKYPLPYDAKRYVVINFYRNVEDTYKSLKEKMMKEAEEKQNQNGGE